MKTAIEGSTEDWAPAWVSEKGELMQSDVVTGAFGYSGAAIARELLAAGHQVRTLTGHPRGGPDAGGIDTRPLDFGNREALLSDLAGAHTLYCTYWVRFPHGTATRESAVVNSKAPVRRGGPRGHRAHRVRLDPARGHWLPVPVLQRQGQVERHLAATGVPYAIARPAILFGSSADLATAASVLVNNIAWLLRHLPAFGIGDGGGYRIRPIHVDDLARLCVDLGGRTDNVTVDAVGPDSPTFLEMVTAIRSATGSRALLVPTPGWLIPPLSAVLGAALRDVLLTTEEYRAMAAGLGDLGRAVNGPGQPAWTGSPTTATNSAGSTPTNWTATTAQHAARTDMPRLDLLESEGRHLVENTGGEVDQGLCGLLVFADVSWSYLGRVGRRVLRVVPAGSHPVELTDNPAHRGVELRAYRLENGEMPAASRRP